MKFLNFLVPKISVDKDTLEELKVWQDKDVQLAFDAFQANWQQPEEGDDSFQLFLHNADALFDLIRILIDAADRLIEDMGEIKHKEVVKFLDRLFECGAILERFDSLIWDLLVKMVYNGLRQFNNQLSLELN